MPMKLRFEPASLRMQGSQVWRKTISGTHYLHMAVQRPVDLTQSQGNKDYNV